MQGTIKHDVQIKDIKVWSILPIWSTKLEKRLQELVEKHRVFS